MIHTHIYNNDFFWSFSAQSEELVCPVVEGVIDSGNCIFGKSWPSIAVC